MTAKQPNYPVGPKRPRLRLRAVVFGLLLLLFAAGTLLLGLGIGSTTTSLPSESHPCLLLKRDDLNEVRERLRRAPYAQWWAQVS